MRKSEEAKKWSTGYPMEREAVPCVPETDTVLRIPATLTLGDPWWEEPRDSACDLIRR